MKNLKYFTPAILCFLLALILFIAPLISSFLMGGFLVILGSLYAIATASKIQKQFESSVFQKNLVPSKKSKNKDLTTTEFTLEILRGAFAKK